MPPLFNYTGGDGQYNGRLFYPNSMARVGVSIPRCRGHRFGAPLLLRGSESEKITRSYIDLLPDECLIEIFRRLTGQERSNCSCVSKQWLTLLSSIRRAEMGTASPGKDVDMDVDVDGCLTRSVQGKKATDTRLAAIAVGTASRGGLGKLSIRGSNPTRGVTDFGLTAIARGCPSLTSLSIWNVSTVGDDGLLEIAKECRKLEKLDLCVCPSISDKGLMAIAEHCPALVALSIESCPNIGNDSIQAIALGCPELESISIKDCPLVGDQAVLEVLSSNSVLSKVKLQSVNISDSSLAAIVQYGKYVTSLTLSCLQNVSENGFYVMGNAQGLEALVSLSIDSCLSDDGLLAFSKSAKSLENINLEHCHKVTFSGIISTLSDCSSNLRSLSIVNCKGLKDTPVNYNFQNCCTSLRRLSIKNCPAFGSPSLKVLGKMCPNLRRVDLTGLLGVTDDGILGFLESCRTGLVRLNLTGCVNVSDESVLAVVRQHGETIKVLHLNGCRNITDASLFAIARCCASLNDLDISNCAVTDSGIAALSSSHLLNLQILSISGCSWISNRSLPYLIQLGNRLTGLNLKRCNSLSIDAVGILLRQLWECDILC
ncbi:hypothetical protein RND81_06G149900 [Saponaria officinalis]|uniref:F-box domain-containing protein n=1 Tax=Saponaria officinalis TaxID=3572 RepID=A0AAW1KAQ8_SAPOF